MVLIVCVLLILWLLLSQMEAQRSLRWWYSRQLLQHCQDAETIRDGLLQEAFTLRRNLELSLINSPQITKETNQELLSTFERLHHDLQELSDRLSPPFLDDSLPLAIQHLLNGWQSNYPFIQVKSNLPSDWPDQRYEQSRLILATLDELIRISLSDASAAALIMLHLTAQKNVTELRIEIQSLNPAMVFPNVQDLHYLEQTFRYLMPGQCSIQQMNGMISCRFRWKSKLIKNLSE
ncbi:MAG: hypothetical protein NW220_13125 [Leptolyngbyaceae cyanobacterium bins.349]|nr:hypothetical protein [Leptolyngbyaceae cyanobacterium bins.349]